MTALPNPFIDSTLPPARAVETAAAPCLDPTVAAAGDFVRGFDPQRFLEAIEEGPAFLRNPSPEYLAAADMIPMLAVLAGH